MNIRELAEQAGLKYHNWITNESNIDDGDFKYPRLEDYKKFAALVVAHEREECAKLCEKQIEKENRLKTGDEQTLSNLLIGHRVTAHMTDARLIRARGEA